MINNIPITSESSSLLGVFGKLRKVLLPSSSLSGWNNSAPTGRIFMKRDMQIFEILSKKIQVLSESEKNNRHFIWRHMYVHVWWRLGEFF